MGTFADLGWRLAALRAFDLFPMTHHVECVAVLRPDTPSVRCLDIEILGTEIIRVPARPDRAAAAD